MEITYIDHSGFAVRDDNLLIIFDYYKGILPNFNGKDEIYFFVSHSHEDHFNKDIFNNSFLKSNNINSSNVNNSNINYIISKDTADKIKYDNFQNKKIVILKAYEELILGKIKVKSFKSTDRGLAYLININGKNIFHAGDLNLWITENMEKSRKNDMIARFERELDLLRGIKITAAFLPLDGRLASCSSLGFMEYLNKLDIEYVFPMHMWGEYQLITEVKKLFSEEKAARIIDISDFLKIPGYSINILFEMI